MMLRLSHLSKKILVLLAAAALAPMVSRQLVLIGFHPVHFNIPARETFENSKGGASGRTLLRQLNGQAEETKSKDSGFKNNVSMLVLPKTRNLCVGPIPLKWLGYSSHEPFYSGHSIVLRI
jgi:hypothetical protein